MKKFLIMVGIAILIGVGLGQISDDDDNAPEEIESESLIDEQITRAPLPSPTPTSEPAAAPTTEPPEPSPEPAAATESFSPIPDCHVSYDPCVPNPPPDLNCDDLDGQIMVDHTHGDPHDLDRDMNGIGCEQS